MSYDVDFEPKWTRPFDLHDLGPIDTIESDKDGNFYFSDEINHRILKYSAEGTLLTVFGSKGSDDVSFHYPMGLLIHEDRLLVCDSWNHRIQIYNTSGQLKQSLSGPDFKVPTSMGVSGNRFWLAQQEKDDLLIIGELGEAEYLSGLGLVYPKRLLVQGNFAIVLDCEKAVFLENRESVGMALIPHPCHTDILAIGPSCGLLLDRLERRLLFFDVAAGVLFSVHQFSIEVRGGLLNSLGLFLFDSQSCSFYEGDSSNPYWWMDLSLKRSPFIFSERALSLFVKGSPVLKIPDNDLLGVLELQTSFLLTAVQQAFQDLEENKSSISTLELYCKDSLSVNRVEDPLPFVLPVRQCRDGSQPLDSLRVLEQWLEKASNLLGSLRKLESFGQGIEKLGACVLNSLLDSVVLRVRVCLKLGSLSIDSIPPHEAVLADIQFFVSGRFQYLLCAFLQKLKVFGSKSKDIQVIGSFVQVSDMEGFQEYSRNLAAQNESDLIPTARSSREALAAYAEHCCRYYIARIKKHEDFAIRVHSCLMSEESRWFSPDGVRVVRLSSFIYPMHAQRASYLAGCDTSAIFPIYDKLRFLFPAHVGFLSGDSKKASQFLKNGLETDSAHFTRCLELLLKGKGREAIERLYLAASRDYGLLYHGFFAFILLQYEEAEQKAQEFLETSPFNVSGLYLLSLAQACQGRYNDALSRFETCPDFSEGALTRNLFLGMFQRMAGRLEASVETLKTLSEQPMAQYQLGISLRMMGREEEALLCFDAEDFNFPCYYNYLQRAVTLLKLDREGEAFEVLSLLRDEHWLPWRGRRLYKNDPQMGAALKTISQDETSIIQAEDRASVTVFNGMIVFAEPFHFVGGVSIEQWLRDLFFGGWLYPY